MCSWAENSTMALKFTEKEEDLNMMDQQRNEVISILPSLGSTEHWRMHTAVNERVQTENETCDNKQWRTTDVTSKTCVLLLKISLLAVTHRTIDASDHSTVLLWRTNDGIVQSFFLWGRANDFKTEGKCRECWVLNAIRGSKCFQKPVYLPLKTSQCPAEAPEPLPRWTPNPSTPPHPIHITGSHHFSWGVNYVT